MIKEMIIAGFMTITPALAQNTMDLTLPPLDQAPSVLNGKLTELPWMASKDESGNTTCEISIVKKGIRVVSGKASVILTYEELMDACKISSVMEDE